MALRSRLNQQRVHPGDWIHVPVVDDSWPVSMQVGANVAVPAFIDRIRSGDSWRTVAALRCPPLVPGIYTVVVRTPTETVTTQIRVQ